MLLLLDDLLLLLLDLSLLDLSLLHLRVLLLDDITVLLLLDLLLLLRYGRNGNAGTIERARTPRIVINRDGTRWGTGRYGAYGHRCLGASKSDITGHRIATSPTSTTADIPVHSLGCCGRRRRCCPRTDGRITVVRLDDPAGSVAALDDIFGAI